MTGYDPDFLPEPVPLPAFSPRLASDVLRRDALRRDALRDRVYADYPNYTVAMHRPFRTLLFAALNVDQNLHKTTDRSDRWRTDDRIGAENQLNNDYYYDNKWDRGHLARRSTAAWGETKEIAQHAADETFYYANASLQHENLNQDEWRALEDWVLDLTLDKGDRFSVFSGPVFGDYMRAIRPPGREPGFVPSAFFKVIFFMNKQDALEVRAFLMLQDEKALKDRKGRRVFDHQIYQVSVTEIETLTGLDFPEVLPSLNPMFFTPSASSSNRNVHELPERREVNGPGDIIRNNDNPRPIRFADDDEDVFIAAALVNAAGNENAGEWVSIANLKNEPVSLDGWKLLDDERRTKTLSGTIGAGEAALIQPLAPVSLANDRDAFIQLVDDRDRQIDRVPYTRQQAKREGKPIVFAYRDLDYDRP